MRTRILFVLIGVVVVTMATIGDPVARAEEGCPPGQVCNPGSCDGEISTSSLTDDCTTETAFFTPDEDTWTYVFDGNNAIKIGTDVVCPADPGFFLTVDKIRISQFDYATLRRDPQFSDTVCNPSFAPPDTDCVFYRVHGETVDRDCYGATVDYKVFWNFPKIQGNKHDWMLLRAPCDEFTGDSNHCFDDPPFSEDITETLNKKAPVGTDPAIGGGADGMSDYIVAISNRHKHKGIPPTIP